MGPTTGRLANETAADILAGFARGHLFASRPVRRNLTAIAAIRRVAPEWQCSPGPQAQLPGDSHGRPAEQEVAVQARHAPLHNAVAAPGTAVESTTGEVHLRHHISPTGFYRGRKVLKTKADA